MDAVVRVSIDQVERISLRERHLVECVVRLASAIERISLEPRGYVGTLEHIFERATAGLLDVKKDEGLGTNHYQLRGPGPVGTGQTDARGGPSISSQPPPANDQGTLLLLGTTSILFFPAAIAVLLSL